MSLEEDHEGLDTPGDVDERKSTEGIAATPDETIVNFSRRRLCSRPECGFCRPETR